MTQTQGQQQPSQFNQRADNAALTLKKDLSAHLGKEIPQRSVEVGPDGRPSQPLPPEGSYARQVIEQQRALAQQSQQALPQGQPTQQQVLGNQPPVGAEQVIDGSQAPPLTNPDGSPQEQDAQLSPNANKRIADLVAQLRDKDQALQQAVADSQRLNETYSQAEARLKALEQQHEELVQTNLDNLDPETRMQVMQNAKIQEALEGFERRIMGQIMPHVANLQEQSAHAEMMRLSEVFPRFDIQVHGPLVEMYRGKNPHSSVRQAFQAIAEPEELVTNAQASATAVPPIVPPGDGAAVARYMPEPTPNPEQEIAEDGARLKKLLHSTDLNDQRQAAQATVDHLKMRLGHNLPGAR